MRITADDLNKTVEEYKESMSIKNAIAVEFDSFNDVDPLTLIRTFDVKPKPEELLSLAELMFNGKSLKFMYGDVVVKSIIYNKAPDSSLSLMFNDYPALLDILLNTVYVLMLKKLTLRSED